MTRALCLSGGAVKGAYQLGVLKRWMGEQGCDYEIMTGVSVGALNIAALAQVPYGRPKEAIDWVIDFWEKNVDTQNIYKRWFPFGRLHALWEKSVYNSQPLIDLVYDNMDRDAILNSKRTLSVGAVCLDTGEHRFAQQSDPNFIDWVLASASFPVFLKPIEIDGKLWSDGGLKNVTPLGEAIRLGATEIDVITTSNIWESSNWTSDTKRAIPDQALRSLDLMNEQIIRNDIQLVGLKNDLAVINPKYKRVKVRIVMPEKSLAENSLEFDPQLVKILMKQGYYDANSFMLYD
jgi:NTE family protein